MQVAVEMNYTEYVSYDDNSCEYKYKIRVHATTDSIVWSRFGSELALTIPRIIGYNTRLKSTTSTFSTISCTEESRYSKHLECSATLRRLPLANGK